jgi:NAD(P)-dependent dehydrogenase (short-subunit alcohol dehydrogenase family)
MKRDLMTLRLLHKRALIVGGTGGLGLSAAQRFLEEGANVVIAGESGEAGAVAMTDLKAIGKVAFIACDVGDSEQVERLFAKTADQLGGLDVLYHVAGISGRRFGDGPLHECTDDGWATTMAVNLTGTFRTNRAAVRQFLRQKSHGAILNMASVVALSPSPHHFDTCAYTAAKGGIIALSRLAAARYASAGIRVNVLAPGLIDTPMSSRAVGDSAIQEYLRTKQPLTAGPGRPEDCAEAAVFLCSDEARFITGVALPVDGGWCVS